MPFQKGNKLGGRTLGAKSATTHDKEARRAVFDAEVSKVFLEKIKLAKPEYLLDQYMGKAPDIIQGDFDLNFDEEKS